MKILKKEFVTSAIIRSGDVLHCTSNGWLARAIKKITKSKVNHTALAIECWGELFIIDSQKEGTHLRPFNQWIDEMKYTYQVSRPINFTSDQKNKAVSKIGFTPYDFMSLILWQPLYILTGKWHGHREDKATKRMYCSEYVAYVFDLPKWWDKSPQEVMGYMQRSPLFTDIGKI